MMFPLVTIVKPHTCTTWAVEVALSKCAFGCKIYKCSVCGAKSVVHSAVYGCTMAHPNR